MYFYIQDNEINECNPYGLKLDIIVEKRNNLLVFRCLTLKKKSMSDKLMC